MSFEGTSSILMQLHKIKRYPIMSFAFGKISIVSPNYCSFLLQYTTSPFGKKPAGGSSSAMPYGGGLAGATAAAAAPAAAAPAPVAAAPAAAAAGLSYGGLPVAPAAKGKSYSPFGKKPASGAKSYR